VLLFSRVSFFDFFHLTNRNIQAAATTKQLIQITGLTASQAIHIVTNPTTRVNAKAINLVPNQRMLDKNGRTLAIVSINSIIIENAININRSQPNLINQVIIWFAFWASLNICSAVTFHSCNKAIVLQLDVV